MFCNLDTITRAICTCLGALWARVDGQNFYLLYICICIFAVSYTHLDVYKRQTLRKEDEIR